MSRKIEVKEVEGKKFYYVDFGYEVHGKTTFRLWIHPVIVKTMPQNDIDEFQLVFPVRNARIEKTEKGNIVLKPYEDWNVFKIGVSCGYRGSSDFEVLEPKDVEIFPYYEYESPRGNLGISKFALVNAQASKLKVKWIKTGRLYGQPSEGLKIYYADGKIEDIENLPDGIEAYEELKAFAE